MNPQLPKGMTLRAPMDTGGGISLPEGMVLKTSVADTQAPGFFQSVAQSIAKPFLKLTSTASDIGAQAVGIGAQALGRPDIAQKIDAQRAKGTTYGYLGNVKPIKSMGEAVGTGLEVGATAASFATGMPSTYVGAAKLFGGISSLSSAGSALSEGDSVKQTVYKTFIGGLTGAVLGVATKGVGDVIEKATTKLPETLYNNVLKISKNMRVSGKSPATFLKDEGTWGSLGSIYNKAQTGIDEMNTAIAPKLANSTDMLQSDEVLNRAVNTLQTKYGAMYSEPQLKAIVTGLPLNNLQPNTSIDVKSANLLRSQIDSVIGDKFWITQGTTPIGKDALEAVSNELRSTIQGISGSAPEFATLSKWIAVKKAAQSAIDVGDQKFGLGLKDLLYTAGGFAGGGTLGAMGTLAAEKIMATPIFKTGLAQVISKVGGLASDKAGYVSKTVLLNLLNGFMNKQQSPNQPK